MALQHGQRVFQEVAIAVVKGQRDEGRTFGVTLSQFRDGVVHGNDAEAPAPDMLQQRVKKVDRDFQAVIWLETLLKPMMHAMEHQDRAGAARIGFRQPMHAARAKKAHPRLDRQLSPRGHIHSLRRRARLRSINA